MKRIFALALAASLMLAGCTSSNTFVTNTTTVLNDIAAATVAACGFVPAVKTIEQILNASNGVLSATEIAGVICKAVTNKPAAKRGDVAAATIEVNGQVIVIHGNFVVGKSH